MPTGDWVTTARFEPYSLFCATSAHPLGQEACGWIREGLIQSLPELRIEQLFEAKKELLSHSDYIVAAASADDLRVMALLASRWVEIDGHSCLHVLIHLISQAFQKTMLVKRMWQLHFCCLTEHSERVPYVITMRTYNPAVFAALRRMAQFAGVELYPAIDGTAQAAYMVELARNVARQLAPKCAFDVSTGVLQGAGVPRDFYPSLPTATSKPEIVDYFSRNLRMGDRILCILHISTDDAWHRVLRFFSLDRVRAQVGTCGTSSFETVGS